MEGNDNSYTQIFIAKIHPRVSEKDLKYKFRKYGEIVDVRLKKGYAFIVNTNLFKIFFERISKIPKKLNKLSKE
jgi:hypothetical protein